MKPLKAIKSRHDTFKTNHFNFFPESYKLKKLHNIHAGEKCFVIGNGPSLKAEDLEVIKNKGLVTFAFNRIYHIFDQTSWRPTYYISQDEKMLVGCVNEVSKLITSTKFIPIQMKWYYDIDISGANFFNIVHDEEKGYPKFSRDITRCVVNAGTVVYSAIQFAVYMGIKEIYLIGVDHQFQTSINEKGEIVVDTTIKDYFSDKYNEDKNVLAIPNPNKSTLTYISAKKYSEKYGFDVYNATRGGKLEVFPRVDFDEVIKRL